MKLHLFFFHILIQSISGQDTLIQNKIDRIEQYTISTSQIEKSDINHVANLIVKSSMTPNTLLTFKQINGIGYQVTRVSIDGQRYWTDTHLPVTGQIERIICSHNAVFFTTNKGHMCVYDEESNHFMTYSTTCIQSFLKVSNKGVYILENQESSSKGMTRFKLLEVNKNDITLVSGDIIVPPTQEKDLIAKRIGNELLLTARTWSTIYSFDDTLTLTPIPITFSLKDGALLRIENITTDNLRKIYVHMVSDERVPIGYMIKISGDNTTQLLETHNVLSVRRQVNGTIKVLATEKLWSQKSYFRSFMDILRNSEAVGVYDASGNNESLFRLQSDTFMGYPGLLKNGIIFANYKTAIGIQLVLHSLNGEEILPPYLKFTGIKVFADGSYLVLGKNNKTKLDWTLYNSLYFVTITGSKLIHITDSPTAIPLRSWQKL